MNSKSIQTIIVCFAIILILNGIYFAFVSINHFHTKTQVLIDYRLRDPELVDTKY